MISPNSCSRSCAARNATPRCRATASRITCSRLRPSVPRRRRTTSSTSARRSNTPSRRSIWTRRCTPTRGTSASRRRCSGRGSATTCSAPSSPRRRRIASSISGAAAAGRCCGTRTGGPPSSASTSARSSPRKRAPASICCSAICGGCRSPTAPSPRRTRSTCSNTCRRRRCAACWPKPARVLAPGGALFVYSHVRKNAPIAAGLRWINALARRLEKLGLIDMRQERLRKSDHLNPLRDIPELEAVAQGRRLPHRADPLLHADRRRPGREHRHAHGRAGDGQARGEAAGRSRSRRRPPTVKRSARRAPRRSGRSRSSPATYAVLRGLSAAMQLDLLLFGRIRSGTVLRPAREGVSLRILYCAIDQVVPGTVGGSVHVTAVAEGLARARTRGPRARVARRGAVSRRSGPLDRDARRRSAARSCAGRARARSRGSRATLEPDAIIERYYNFGGEGILAGAALGEADDARSQRAGDRLPGLEQGADRSAAARRADAPLARAHLPAARPSSSRPSAAILPPDTPPSKIVELEWGADTDRFRPGAAGPLPFARPPGVLAVFAGAFRRWHGAERLVEAMRQLRAPRRRRRLGGADRRRPGAAARQGRSATGSRTSPSPAPVAHDAMPACLAAADIGVAPFDSGRARARSRSASTGRRSRFSSTWRRGCRWSRPRCRASPRSWRDEREGAALRPPQARRRSRTRSIATARSRAAGPARRGGARARGARLQLGRALPRARARACSAPAMTRGADAARGVA